MNETYVGNGMCSRTTDLVAKENYYALAMSIINGWTPDYCLGKMGVAPKIQPYKRKKLGKYREIATIAYVVHTICGFGYEETAKLLGKSWSQIRDAVYFTKGITRERRR